METTTEHVSIHMPKYETQPVRFDSSAQNVPADVICIQDLIREKAEKNLVQCKSFEVSLPSSITGITNDSDRIKFELFFQTPALNELETLSTNPDGSSLKLNQEQLKSVKQTGEFEVNSIHFPGQCHRWKLSKLLQSGIKTKNEKFYHELSMALHMLIVFARDRVVSNCFSFRAVLRSWRHGFVSLIDALIGLPAVTSPGIDSQVEEERQKFLVIELSPHEHEKEMHEAFCAQLPNLLEIMAEHDKYTRRKNLRPPPPLLPYPQSFVTPSHIEIDLRLHNHDLQAKLQSIIGVAINECTPKNWFHTTKRRLINEFKQDLTSSSLSKNEIAQRVQTQLNQEYTERVFRAIESSHEIESLSPGLGRLLVEQARSVLIMQSVVQKLNEDLDQHIETFRGKLIREHPIKSKLSRWLDKKVLEEKLRYVHEHEWDAHHLSIDQCKAQGYHQAAYFIQRDLTFRQDHEATLRHNLKRPIEPVRTFNCNRNIWFPKNWIIERTYPLPVERFPAMFEEHQYTPEEEERRITLLHKDHEAQYSLRKNVTYSTTTRYPFWRWKLFVLRAFCWLSNSIRLFCLVIPFASPVSFRALFSIKPFYPNYELNEKTLKLRADPHMKMQTFISRLTALWNHVSYSRRQFEQTPDRGILGKNIQRIFNRLWNYVGKGFIGSLAICIVYPVVCLVVPTLSIALGILSPIWMPLLTLLVHILQIIFYDANSAGEYGRKFFCLINILATDFFLCGIVQPALVLVTLISSPIISLFILIFAFLHRTSRGAYDHILYHLVVKRLARVPAHNTFLARRIAGPGLASQYFYQVSSPEVLAALEALVEQNELKVYRAYVEQILMKPIEDYRQFFNQAFRPFSASIETVDDKSVYGRMKSVVNEHINNLKIAVDKRNNLLQLRQSSNHNRIRLTESDLSAVLIEGTKMVQKWYSQRILPYYNKNELERFWNDYDLEENDWFGLTSKLLQNLFCRDFLTPLEQTDIFYSLQVDHMSVSKYAHMIHSANIQDDLDVVTSVYLPETSYSIDQPSFDQRVLNPSETVLNISRDYFGQSQKHRRVWRFFNRQGTYFKRSKTILSRFVDYTSITCHYSIPILLPDIAYINVIIFNRANNDVTTTTSIKTLSSSDVHALIEFCRRFHKESFPSIDASSSIGPMNLINSPNDDLVLISPTLSNNDVDVADNNTTIVDEMQL